VRIQWNLFFRLASPLAIVTGVAAYLFSPFSLVLILPVCLKRIIARYRPFHSGVLQASQGALMGTFMAVLSFAAFLVFALATVSLQRAPVLDKLRAIAAIAAQNPNPKAQQMALWLPTNEGFIVFVAFAMALALAIFLISGAVSGALIMRTKKLP
jgi:energy-converting hydrogenase Eha subunit E